MRLLLAIAFFVGLGAISGCNSTGSGSASSGSGTPSFTTPSTMDTQNRIESVHRERNRF